MAGRSYVEVSAPYANFMLHPAKSGDRVCRICRSFTGEGYLECVKCGFQPSHLDVVVPIAYSVGRGQMHHALRHYKDGGTSDVRRRFSVELAAVLWRFLLRQHSGPFDWDDCVVHET
jgi:hypothetical protein